MSEARPLNVELGILSSVDGSVRLRAGGTVVLASVIGPRPARNARIEDPTRAILEVHLSGTSGSGGSSVRDAELVATLRGALTPLVLLRAAPRSVITVSILIEAEDGGAAPNAFNAAVLALSDAGVPLRGLAAAAAVALRRAGDASASGRGDSAAENGTAVIDPSAEEMMPGAFHALLWAAFPAAPPSDGMGSADGVEGAGFEAIALVSTGPTSRADLGALLIDANAQAQRVVAFMRDVLVKRVMRDAVNCAPEVRSALGVK